MKKNEQQTIPHFFIMGRTRSGTTMLRSMFDAHPQVCIPPEYPVLYCLRRFGNSIGSKEAGRLFSVLTKCPKFRDVKISHTELKAALEKAFADSDPVSTAEVYRRVMLLYRSPYQKSSIKMIGDKNPLYSLHVRRIRNMFPDAKFIFLRRHLFNVVDSVFRAGFELHWPAFIAFNWRKSVRLSISDMSMFPENTMVLRYEDIVSDPKLAMEKACAFLDISYHESMIHFNETHALEATFGQALQGAHRSLLMNVKDADASIPVHPAARRHRIAAAWAGKSIKLAGYEQPECKYRWFYFLLGIPSVVAAQSLRVFGFIIHTISFGRWHPWLLARLALMLNRRKQQRGSTS